MHDQLLVSVLSAIVSLGAELIHIQQVEETVETAEKQQESQLIKENPDPLDTNQPNQYNVTHAER